MKETCNTCKFLWDTLDINCVCLYDDLPLNGDFLDVPDHCEDWKAVEDDSPFYSIATLALPQGFGKRR